MYCSIHQAVGIWTELLYCYEKRNGFGTDTAEIYAYRLMPYNPTAVIHGKDKEEDIILASKSLIALIDMFCEEYDTDFKIVVGRKDIKGGGWKHKLMNRHLWLKKYGHTFDHRIHVECIKPIKCK